MRKILGLYDSPQPHWVGDGFPVRSMFAHGAMGGGEVSPFLLLDHAGPAEFSPSDRRRGVGVHPHRGFETVTIVYEGEVDHRDSSGGGGHIGPGDVQWMTAASGILHEEFHSDAFTRRGGVMEMAQLWVNLPAGDKGAPPAYQTLVATDIPTVELPDGAGTLRVIAGEYDGAEGPARTFTPIDVWDLRLKAGGRTTLAPAEGRMLGLAVLSGTVQVNGDAVARGGQFVLLDRNGGEVVIEANNAAKILVLSGEPIEEPVAWHGPFVMNTRQELVQAIEDFNAGRFGAIPA